MNMDFPTVPAFLTKLWALVDDPLTNDLICWDVSGKSFHVVDQTRFAKEILPLYYKHKNINSFIRQLNMYGFKKVNPSVETVTMRAERDDLMFAHKYFLHGQEHLLENIKRRTPRGQALSPNSKQDFSAIFGEVSNMKNQLDSMTDTLENLRIENECLWKEVVNLRQKHARQQQVVSKLVQFFISLVNKDHNSGSLKRKLPLMIKGPDDLEAFTSLANDASQGDNTLSSLSTLKQTSDALQGFKSLKDMGKPKVSYFNKIPTEENKGLKVKEEPIILQIPKSLLKKPGEFSTQQLEPLTVIGSDFLSRPCTLSDLIDVPDELCVGDVDLSTKNGAAPSEGSASKELIMKCDYRNIFRDFDKEDFLRSQNTLQHSLETVFSMFDDQQIDLNNTLLLDDEMDEGEAPQTKKLKLANSHGKELMHYIPEDHNFNESLIELSEGNEHFQKHGDDNDVCYSSFLCDDFL